MPISAGFAGDFAADAERAGVPLYSSAVQRWPQPAMLSVASLGDNLPVIDYIETPLRGSTLHPATVWDLIPRNVLRDRDGDIFVVDAEIKRNE